MWRNGRLLAVHRDGARLNAYLDDYAFLLDAMLELLQARIPHRGSGSSPAQLADVLLEQFEDRDAGRFLFHQPRSRAADTPPQARLRQRHALGQRRRGACLAAPGARDGRYALSGGRRARLAAFLSRARASAGRVQEPAVRPGRIPRAAEHRGLARAAARLAGMGAGLGRQLSPAHPRVRHTATVFRGCRGHWTSRRASRSTPGCARALNAYRPSPSCPNCERLAMAASWFKISHPGFRV